MTKQYNDGQRSSFGHLKMGIVVDKGRYSGW